MRLTKQFIMLVIVLVLGWVSFTVATRPELFAPHMTDKQLYGEWVEQDVAPYAADRFEIRPDGVYTNGSRATTEYQFDGDQLKYTIGTETYLYRVEDAKTLERIEPAHYTSFFAKDKRS
ncbi:MULTISPECIES: DUF2850 domain-containing protein [Salinivibrio]|uniref:DUF2850 domain-containing protein n=1 Tax=Salinivibrio siamensis TaxID=414286 RepID=A0ABX3KFB8_9GAMM|nr:MULTISPECIES: DUF2850 domain-containing protein [Salinivibrio]MPS32175.1 DUF2850 domain-containing protein [Salinivibrio sp. VYel7]MPX89922.1 DUF2850 domain-containing protein [Salinivibrio sp. VYel1]MPX93569.1 DUF2850 domain-containing protein [Salinivibrio sp. VYel9]MPX96401.1 DUF2850 domain-containing protein [Salinivibrio sp. VYel6]MPX99947.1 DUF2850 domain-containing protein [Salinivibrio sp. VYel4]MPY02838.1 DUF2850 domain-containing protein [Salinivibrio sp. VYel5]MPY05755.1 DUF285